MQADTQQTKKLPAIVLCQGLSGVKHKVLPDIAKIFAQNGYAVLAFDYRGCGESEGDIPLADEDAKLDIQLGLRW